jgi:outer membrane receptor for ferrienterochelin and colicin
MNILMTTSKGLRVKIEPYTLWKAVLTQRMNDMVDLTVGVDNIFDYTDSDGMSTLDPGRRIFAEISVHHKFDLD